uniref:Aegyptin/gSG7 salivary protein-like four-helix bundle domain-containing protein n=1 Tax=Anopheles atroparvus TaxID=41427 RepID=A0AAG5D835_ANOAO
MSFKAFCFVCVSGIIFLLQVKQSNATFQHAKEVLQYFKRVRLDNTKNSVYQSQVRYGIRNVLRNPLLAKAACLKREVKLSTDCLNRMVDKARQHENKFYAKFTYACRGHAEYSAECLESARPKYYRRLKALVAQTEKCWKL